MDEGDRVTYESDDGYAWRGTVIGFETVVCPVVRFDSGETDRVLPEELTRGQ